MGVLAAHMEAEPAPPPISPEARVAARAAMTEQHWKRLAFHVHHSSSLDHKDTTDNDLMAAGYIVPLTGFSALLTGRVGLTVEGRLAHAERTQENRRRRRAHEDFAGEIAATCLPPGMILRAVEVRGAIPDVLWLSGSRQTRLWNPTVIEVKASRADALADLRAEKWRKYQAFAERVYFAAPEGALAAADLPPECGLFLREGAGIWRRARNAKRNRTWEMDAEAVMDIAIHLARRNDRAIS